MDALAKKLYNDINITDGLTGDKGVAVVEDKVIEGFGLRKEIFHSVLKRLEKANKVVVDGQGTEFRVITILPEQGE